MFRELDNTESQVTGHPSDLPFEVKPLTKEHRSHRPRRTALENARGGFLWVLVLGIPLVSVAIDGFIFNSFPAFDSKEVVLPSTLRGSALKLGEGRIHSQRFNLSIPDPYGTINYLKYSVRAAILSSPSGGPEAPASAQRRGSVHVWVSPVPGPPALVHESVAIHRSLFHGRYSSHATILSAGHGALFAVGGIPLDGPFSGISRPRTVFVEGDVTIPPGQDEGAVEDEYTVSIIFEFASPVYFLCVAVLRVALCAATATGARMVYLRRLHRGAPDQGSFLQPLPEQTYCAVLLVGLFLWQNPFVSLRVLSILAFSSASFSDFNNRFFDGLAVVEGVAGSVGMFGVLFSLVALFSGIGFPAEWILHTKAPGSRVSADGGLADIGGRERMKLWSDRAVAGGSYGSIPSASLLASSNDAFLCPHDPESPLFLDFIWPKLIMLVASCALAVVQACLLHAELFSSTSHIETVSTFVKILDFMYSVVIIAWVLALWKAFRAAVRRFEGDYSSSGSAASIGGRHARDRDPGSLYACLATRLLKYQIDTFLLILISYFFWALYSNGFSNMWTVTVPESRGSEAAISPIYVPLQWSNWSELILMKWIDFCLFLSAKLVALTLFALSQFGYVTQFAFLEDDNCLSRLNPADELSESESSGQFDCGFDIELACYLLECSWQTYFVGNDVEKPSSETKNPFEDSDSSDECVAMLPQIAQGASLRDVHHLGLAIVCEIRSLNLDLHCYIAVDKIEKRLVLAFRGTTGLHNVATDLSLSQVDLPELRLPMKLDVPMSRTVRKASVVRKLIDWFIKWRDRLEHVYPDEVVCDHEFSLHEVVGSEFRGDPSCWPAALATSGGIAAEVKSTCPRIHSGFWNAYSQVRLEVYKGINKALNEIIDVDFESNVVDLRSWNFYITGHSLGGALATIATLDLTINLRSLLEVRTGCLKEVYLPQLGLFTYGSPRVGNADFKDYFEKLVKHSFRIEVNGDLVCRVPALMGYRHAANVPVLLCDAVNHPGSSEQIKAITTRDLESAGGDLSRLSWLSGSSSWASFTTICVIRPTYAQFWLMRKQSGHPNYHSLIAYRNYLESLLSDEQKIEYFGKYYARNGITRSTTPDFSIDSVAASRLGDSSGPRRISALVREFGTSA